MTKIKAADLIALFRQAHKEKWGYIWGTRGQVWTQANQDAATREMTVKYGQKWVGRKVADCSGLFVWAFKQLGGSIYHGSNTIWNKYTNPDMRGTVGGQMTIRPGAAVFQVSDGRRTHIGLYVGGGKCIEAQGTRTGVVESDLSRWDEWGELSDADYSGVAWEAVEVAMPTLRKGDSGSLVQTLQNGLIEAGYGVGESGADGIFGRDTLATVRAFQHDHGLNPDGIVGPLTWAAIKAVTEDDELPQSGKPDSAPEIEPEDAWDSLSDAEKLDDLNERLKRLEGGETHV